MVWRWLTENLNGLLSTPGRQIALALISVVCGAIVGTEREKREKPAGLRTLILVCLGATAFTMASFAFTTSTGDSGRVSAQIVTGIGFLGAGAILHSSGIVRGMTTAATIWATAATGMIVGIGYAGAGLGLSLLVRMVLTASRAWEHRVSRIERTSRIELAFEANGGKTRVKIEKIMEDFHVHVPLEAGTPAGGIERARLQFQLPPRHRAEFLNEIALLPEVKELIKVEN
jgi:putative Mg2+ transporter-C (MgtC) family protein